MNENIVKEILSDDELKEKYNLSDTMIEELHKYASHKDVINYVITMVNAKMIEANSDQTVYNKIKSINKI